MSHCTIDHDEIQSTIYSLNIYSRKTKRPKTHKKTVDLSEATHLSLATHVKIRRFFETIKTNRPSSSAAKSRIKQQPNALLIKDSVVDSHDGMAHKQYVYTTYLR